MTSRHTDQKHDNAIEDSFPASDPPASTGITGPRAEDPGRATRNPKARPPSPQGGPEDTRPQGTPIDARHAVETAYHSEHEDGAPER